MDKIQLAYEKGVNDALEKYGIRIENTPNLSDGDRVGMVGNLGVMGTSLGAIPGAYYGARKFKSNINNPVMRNKVLKYPGFSGIFDHEKEYKGNKELLNDILGGRAFDKETYDISGIIDDIVGQKKLNLREKQKVLNRFMVSPPEVNSVGEGIAEIENALKPTYKNVGYKDIMKELSHTKRPLDEVLSPIAKKLKFHNRLGAGLMIGGGLLGGGAALYNSDKLLGKLFGTKKRLVVGNNKYNLGI